MSARSKPKSKKGIFQEYDDPKLDKSWNKFRKNQTKELNDYATAHPNLKEAIDASIKTEKTILTNENEEKSFANNYLYEPKYNKTGVQKCSKTHFWSRKRNYPHHSICINGIWGCYHQAWQKVGFIYVHQTMGRL